jgi:hypothetical protein
MQKEAIQHLYQFEESVRGRRGVVRVTDVGELRPAKRKWSGPQHETQAMYYLAGSTITRNRLPKPTVQRRLGHIFEGRLLI